MTPEGSDEYDLPVTSKGVMRLTPRLRETYLTQQAGDGECFTQSAGHWVHVWLCSDRRDIRIDIPRSSFGTTRGYEQSVHRWGISINRYLSDDGVRVDESGEKPTVAVRVVVVS